ncbi:MAG: hypothetical protein R3C52_13655 [Hyphomonadaceae bacterium]
MTGDRSNDDGGPLGQGFCFKCGTPIPDNTWMCPSCGFVNAGATAGAASGRSGVRKDLTDSVDDAKRDIRDRLRKS